MEITPAAPTFTPENWQSFMMETAEYAHPAPPEVMIKLSEKLVFEAMELIMPAPDEPYPKLGRIAVLLPVEHAKYFRNEPFMELHDSPDLKKRVAGEFGDILWYQTALLREKDITVEEVLGRAVEKMGSVGVDTSGTEDLRVFSHAAAAKEPASYTGEQSIDENPFVVYGGWYISMFARSVSPEYAPADITKEEIIDKAADLLWATTYLLEHYCNTNLQTVLQNNYQKLSARAKAGIPQGQGVGDDRWSVSS